MNSSADDPRAQFAELFKDDDRNIDLIDAALLIAAEHHPECSLDDCRDEIKSLGREAKDHVNLQQPSADVARNLCDFLYRQANYCGDHQDYYNPDNSYLDRVLSRRKGIPVTLALVYIGVGESLGLRLEPIGFPGHFLLKLVGDEEIMLDPFSGQVLSEGDCRELLKTCTQNTVAFKREYLSTISNREVVRRILGNLKGIYANRKELDEALVVCDQLLLINKDSPQDLLDRALILERMDCHAAAAEDLEYLLTLTPPEHVDKSLREKIIELRDQAGGQVH